MHAFIKELGNAAPTPTEFLKGETRLLCFADNFNEYLSTKHQDGNAGEMRNFCVVYIMKMIPLPDLSSTTMYPIDEVQPTITFLNQKVPAPVLMLPYELIGDDDRLTLIYLVQNMRAIARKHPRVLTSLYQRMQLGSPTPFPGVSKIKATNGERARAYYNLVAKMLATKRLASTLSGLSEQLPRPMEYQFAKLLGMFSDNESYYSAVKTFHSNVVRDNGTQMPTR